MVIGFESKPGCGWRLMQMGLQISITGRVGEDLAGTTADDVAAQAVIDAWTLADSVSWVVPQVKERARAGILARYPEWKQTNMAARSIELVEAQTAAPLSTADAAELTALKAAWAWIKSVRAASNTHEAALSALTTYAAIAAYDWHTGWPE